MKTLTLKINESTENGRTFMELLEVFVKNKKGVEIMESPYDPEFVAKIRAREKESKPEKLVPVNPEDLWGSIS